VELLRIDAERCARCGLCAQVCPLVIITQDEEGLPAERENTASRCINCGHCVAVCPTGALGTVHSSPEDCTPLSPKDLLDTDAAFRLFGMRRSVRRYLPEPIPQAELDRILETAHMAPSASNLRPVRWTVVEGAERLHRIAAACVETMRGSGNDFYAGFVRAFDKGHDVILRGCTTLVTAHSGPEFPWGQVDCVIAAAHLELAASVCGYGACWAGFVMRAAQNSDEVRVALGLPEGHAAHACMMLGRPALRYARIPLRGPVPVRRFED
jgi:nitroreductase/Pyruvate/2-oxoacid:ferredoxin oxidoreductase delta subunit